MRKTTILAALALALLAFSLYVRTLGYPFLGGWDDNVYVTENTRLAPTAENFIHWLRTPCLCHYIPATMFSYMFDYSVWGLDPLGFRLQSLFWHLVAVIALFGIFCRLQVPVVFSFLLCLLFAWSPQRIESVAWISERKDVLCAALYMLCILAHLKWRDRGFSQIIPFILFIAAILSKSMALSIPAVLFCINAYLDRGWNIRRNFLRLWPYFAVAAAFIPITYLAHAIPETQQFIPGRRLVAAVFNFAWYFNRAFLPADLSPIYPRTPIGPATFMQIGLFYGAMAVIFRWLWVTRRDFLLHKALPFLLCYAFSLAPVCGLVPLGSIDRADRYSYLPSAFILLLAGISILEFARARSSAAPQRLIIAFLSAAAVFSAIASLKYSSTFSSLDELLEKACEIRSPNPMAAGTLAGMKIKKGDYAEAWELIGRLESMDGSELTAENIEGNRIKAAFLRGHLLFRIGDKTAALETFSSIRGKLGRTSFFSPEDHIGMLALIADCQMDAGNIPEAQKTYKEITESLKEENFELFFYRGMMNYISGDIGKAAENFGRALQLRPDDERALKNLEECSRLSPSRE